MKTIIQTSNAPAPIGPYNQAVLANGVLYVSGQIPMDPNTGEILNGTIEEEKKALMSSSSDDIIDFQSDEANFGRGDFHLSAALNEGDVVVYQTGTWLVDGVEVGDGTPPTFKYARIDTIQIVWTHNCEHGQLRGIQLNLVQDDDTYKFVESDPMIDIEFGPEQLLARVPVSWDETKNYGISSVPVSDDMWYEHAFT